MMNRLLVFIQHPAMQTALLNVYRMCTPAGVSPLLSDSRGPSPYNEPEISALGTPVLFSKMSANSLLGI